MYLNAHFCYNTVMLVIDYLRWWYGQGWEEAGLLFLRRIQLTYRDFSVLIVLKTLFKPWRQTIEGGERTLSKRFKAILGNTVSRSVGASVRISSLIIAVFLMLAEGIAGLVAIIIWPLIPIAGLVCLFGGLV